MAVVTGRCDYCRKLRACKVVWVGPDKRLVCTGCRTKANEPKSEVTK